jgi:hypothetical protein
MEKTKGKNQEKESGGDIGGPSGGFESRRIRDTGFIGNRKWK